jgi:hypothetical protein
MKSDYGGWADFHKWMATRVTHGWIGEILAWIIVFRGSRPVDVHYQLASTAVHHLRMYRLFGLACCSWAETLTSHWSSSCRDEGLDVAFGVFLFGWQFVAQWTSSASSPVQPGLAHIFGPGVCVFAHSIFFYFFPFEQIHSFLLVTPINV